jgi:benzoyl-CoA reductase/2-hydroxyglutaryl-CoA dehydratase subunit BcrC/BadD/HgdB
VRPVFVRAPKFAFTARRLKQHSNPLYESLRERFREHEAEEEGHDQWVLNDLINLGQNPDIVQRINPCDEIDAYNATRNSL